MDNNEAPKITEEPTEAIIKVGKDKAKTRAVLRCSSGKFASKKKPTMPDASDLIRRGREILFEKDEAGETKFEAMLRNLIDIATNSKDEKKVLSAVKAFEAVCTRCLGKPSPSDAELDALQLAGVKVVIVQPPTLMHPEPIKELALPPLRPSFIDAELIQQNEPTHYDK